MRYVHPASHIFPLAGRLSTFFVVYRAARANMDSSSNLETCEGCSVRGGDGVEDQATLSRGLPASCGLETVQKLALLYWSAPLKYTCSYCKSSAGVRHHRYK